MRKFVISILMSLALATAGSSQSLSLTLLQHSTDNLFQTRFSERDRISHLAFSLDQPLRPLSFFTEGGYSYLAENSRISFYTQELGLDYLCPAGAKTALYASVKAGGALYREDYKDFNYLSVGFLGAVKSYLTPSSILKLTYAFSFKAYPVDRFDFHSHLVTLSTDRYFPSRTTLKVEAVYGYKHFLHPFTVEPIVIGSTGGTGTAGGSGRRHGANLIGQTGSALVADGAGRGSGLQTAAVSGLIAQGLGDRLGLRLSGFRQWTLSGENPFRSISEFYMVENPTYDVFSWNGYGLSGEATAEGPWNTQLKLGYIRSVKRFPGIEATDLDGGSLGLLRRDTRNQWEARLRKDFTAVSLSAYYTYIDNASNDPLFNWKGHFLGIGVEWRLDWGKR